MIKDEVIKVQRVSIIGGKVRLSIVYTKRGTGSTSKSYISEDLSEVYEKRGKIGLDTEILRLCAKGKMKIIGSHKSILEYKEILANPDNLQTLSEEKTDILLDDISTREAFTGKTFTIQMASGDYLAGVLTVKIGEHTEYVPYGTKDMPHKPIKYFVLREQARAYLNYIRQNCPAYYTYKLEIVEKVNDSDFSGIAKIAKWCEKQGIQIRMPKKPVILEDKMTKTFRFPNREYKLEAEITNKLTTYRFFRRKTILCESTKQLDIIDEMKKYKLK